MTDLILALAWAALASAIAHRIDTRSARARARLTLTIAVVSFAIASVLYGRAL